MTRNPPTHDPNYPLSPNEQALVTTLESTTGLEYRGCFNREHPSRIGVVTYFVFATGLNPKKTVYQVLTHKEIKNFLKVTLSMYPKSGIRFLP